MFASKKHEYKNSAHPKVNRGNRQLTLDQRRKMNRLDGFDKHRSMDVDVNVTDFQAVIEFANILTVADSNNLKTFEGILMYMVGFIDTMDDNLFFKPLAGFEQYSDHFDDQNQTVICDPEQSFNMLYSNYTTGIGSEFSIFLKSPRDNTCTISFFMIYDSAKIVLKSNDNSFFIRMRNEILYEIYGNEYIDHLNPSDYFAIPE